MKYIPKETRVRVCDLGIKEAIEVLSLNGILWCKVASGVWNDYGDLIPCDEKVFERIRKSPYGACIDFVYDGEPQDDDENLLYAEISMPCDSDMW